MDTLRTLQLIENELRAVEEMIHEARCCIYTDRRMRQAPNGCNEKEWSPIIRLDPSAAAIDPRPKSHEEIVYRSQELIAFAKMKLGLLARLTNGKQDE